MLQPVVTYLRRVFRFPVLGRLWKFIVAIAIYSSLVVEFGSLVFRTAPENAPPPSHTGEIAISGILFGWLMSFRTQTSYSRWWEGRCLWGQLVNESRNLVLKAAALVPDPIERQKIAVLIVRFAETLRDRLRLPRSYPGPHLPMGVAGELFNLIRSWQSSGKIDGYAFLALDQHAQQLMNVCGACEKIQKTPLAASYSSLLRKGITAYLLLLPWLMKDEVGWSTVPACVLTGYALVGLELISSSIEDPFGYDGDDLPLDDIVETIRKATTAA